jgi:hypothetical protein
MAKDKGTRALLAAITLILISGAVAIMFDSDDAVQQRAVSNEWTQTFPPKSQQEAVTPIQTPLSATKTEAGSDPGMDYSDSNHPGTAAEARQENPYLNHEVKARLAQVAEVYANQIRYPAFSMPIPNRDALQKYLPNRSFYAERALDIKDENSPRIRLQTDRHQYFTGDTIKLTVSLEGLTGNPWVAVQARLVAGGQTLATVDASAAGQQTATYHMRIAGLDSMPDSGMDEYRVVARITIDGKVYEIGTPVSYVSSVAEVTSVGMARVSGEYIHIPVDVTTTKPGYHELTANLYAVRSDKPLLHLTAQQELKSAIGLMQLKAHIASLKVGGDPGPYLLKDITFTRMPSPPDFTTEYGKSSQDSYEVRGYAFDEYDDVPYVDEEARRRLEFLRQLGSVN